MTLNMSFTAGFDPLPTIQGDNVTPWAIQMTISLGFSQDMMQQFSYRIPSGVFLPFHQEPR